MQLPRITPIAAKIGQRGVYSSPSCGEMLKDGDGILFCGLRFAFHVCWAYLPTIISPNHHRLQVGMFGLCDLFLGRLLFERVLLFPPSQKVIFRFIGTSNIGSLPFQLVLGFI